MGLNLYIARRFMKNETRNELYEKMLKDGVSQQIIDKFLRISPIAWAYIAFTGKYNFKKSDGQIDIAAMVDALEKHLKQRFWNDSKTQN